jgi:hypothetical protein
MNGDIQMLILIAPLYTYFFFKSLILRFESISKTENSLLPTVFVITVIADKEHYLIVDGNA